jgi:hypothetical protein
MMVRSRLYRLVASIAISLFWNSHPLQAEITEPGEKQWIVQDSSPDNPITYGDVAVLDMMLRQRGLDDTMAYGWTSTLVPWLRASGHADGNSMKEASLTLLSMLDDEGLSFEKIQFFCGYVSRCWNYIGDGTALRQEEAQRLISQGRLETRCTLAKMFAVAALDYLGSSEASRMVLEARRKPIKGSPPLSKRIIDPCRQSARPHRLRRVTYKYM